MMPTRDQAYQLLLQYNQTPGLIKHALAVEATMRHFAQHFNQDPEIWGIIGLIHDLDYEKYPDIHCQMTEKILQENGWPEDYIRAALSHGWGICTDLKPESLLEKTLFTIDELTGLVTTSALVRPTKSILDMKAKSVKSKWADKRFAAKIDRSIIEKGAVMMGMELTQVIELTIEGMAKIADQLELDGRLATNQN
ncbi:MAG TPA: hydrolase [Marinilabiliales bacterium]|nr:MAG: hydrolase [Bacteroidetes bacterium GWC2_40_13]OFX73976.1 MAG: hydrolase [Bacteroidetes bacterium GWD2_40_43]OFX93190.1 MAG: hydrolase [Bacteroidetes bacterium GWE2_40_63]OFY21560.1 MAG: hydrolase [Bacteroidetes bacterium GWF2_40_13]OFZ24213.1 MAG: hydrolase [Bacteroidetes bacterium RIFOXYC2_FULL_40_12]HAM98042.1 hydrolase [Marinilabiliales bacterium]